MSGAGKPLSAQNPWPGLASFSELDQAYFRGRGHETDELARLVRRERLSVLFGRSGLGKSSLLAAGLAPRLREDLHLPVLLRIDYRAGMAPRQQVWQALAAEAARWHVAAEAPRDDETLWAFFHRAGGGFWSDRNRPVLPVLVFDQFEELFTLGQSDEAARAQATAFVAELADLVEDRMPLVLQQALERDPQLAEAYDGGRRGCKVVLSFREDYLAQIEGLRSQLPSVMRNRFRLLPMDAAQARAVVGSGGDLVAPDVVPRLLGLAWNNKAEAPPDDGRPLEFDPALLSVICAELNRLRLAAGESHIELGRLETSGAGILGNFYDRTIAGVSPALKHFVEDELVTPTGVRDSRALDDALARPGVTAAEVRHLVDGRLLRMDDRFGVQRLELTHDVLTGVIAERRRTRRAQEAEAAARAREREAATLQLRNRRRLLFSGAGVALAGALLLWAGYRIVEADRATARAAAEIRKAADDTAALKALAEQSAQIARDASQAKSDAEQLMLDSQARADASTAAADAATRQAAALLRDATATDLLANAREGSERSIDRSLLLGAVAVDRFPDRLDARLQQLARLLAAEGRQTLLRIDAAIESAATSPDRRLLALGTADGQVVVVDTGSWREQRRWRAHTGESVVRLAFSPDARRLVSTSREQIAAWSVDGGAALGRIDIERLGRGLRMVQWSPDGTQLALAVIRGSLGRWTLDGSPSGQLATLPLAASCLRFDDQGTLHFSTSAGPGRWTAAGEHVQGSAAAAERGTLLDSTSDCLARIVLRPAAASAPRAIELVRDDDGDAPVVLGEAGPDRPRPSIGFAGFSEGLVAHQVDDELWLWSGRPARRLEPIRLPEDIPTQAIELSADGRWVGVAQGRRLLAYERNTGRQVLDVALPERAQALAFSPDGRTLMPITLRTGGRSLLSVYRVAPAAGALRGADGAERWSGIEFNRSGSILVLVSGSDFHFWDVAKGGVIDTVKNLRLGEFSPDGRFVVLLHHGGSYSVRSLTGTPREIFARPAAPDANPRRMSVALGRDGRLLAVLLSDGTVLVHDVPGNTTVHRLEPDPDRRQVAISPDLQTLAVAGLDGRVTLHRLGPGRGHAGPLATAHMGRVARLMFSPDGRWIASGGEDHAVLVHEVATGARVARLDEPHDTEVDWLVFVEGGRVLVTGAEKGVRHLWHTRTWHWLGKLGGAGSGVGAVDLSPTAGRSAVRSHHNQVSLRRWDRDTLLQDSCALAGRNLSCAEWRQYVPGLPYAKVCPALPPPSDGPCRH